MRGWTQEAVDAHRRRMSGGGVVVTPAEPSKPAQRQAVRQGGPNKTEARYNRERLGGLGRYEALTFRLPGGSRYTPDWCLPGEVHEVKGAYRFGSHGRAWTAFREAAAAFPEFRFVWAEQQKDKTWFVKFDSKGKS